MNHEWLYVVLAILGGGSDRLGRILGGGSGWRLLLDPEVVEDDVQLVFDAALPLLYLALFTQDVDVEGNHELRQLSLPLQDLEDLIQDPLVPLPELLVLRLAPGAHVQARVLHGLEFSQYFLSVTL